LAQKKERKYKDFGDLLRRLRRENFGDIDSFAKTLTGISKYDLYEYEGGRVFPPIDKFINICKKLNKSPEYMLSPLLDIKIKDKDILELTERLKIVCQDSRNIDKLNGYLSSLEQELLITRIEKPAAASGPPPKIKTKGEIQSMQKHKRKGGDAHKKTINLPGVDGRAKRKGSK